jgi:hypothetical protein
MTKPEATRSPVIVPSTAVRTKIDAISMNVVELAFLIGAV